MATESSDPRVGLIFRIGILAIGTLVVIHVGMTSYFDSMARAEVYKKVGSVKPDALMNMRADEQQRLASGPMPIEKSMQMMASKGRMGAAPELAPSASKDTAPLQGWMQMPAEVPPTMMEPAPAPGAPSAAPSASASTSPAGNKAPKHP